MGKVLKIREVGEPILEEECYEVDIKNISRDTLETIEDLKATLEFGTGLGIAAPQIGVNKRIIVVGAKKERVKYNDAEEIPITAMINPTWKRISKDTDIQYEGCMSVPIIRGKVERYKDIELTYYDKNGKQIKKEIHGFFARLVQHECDHLDGIVFLEKVKGPNGFATIDNINKYNLREIDGICMKEINQELVKYIESEIFPLYNRNEEGHGIGHIKTVIKRSLELAKNYDVDLNMVYVIASYHDIGHYIDRKKHEIISAEMFMKDEKIKKWFTTEQIYTIKEAIEDHRASSNHEPRTIYGRIVSTADRTIIDIDNTIRRSYSYGKRNYVGLSEEEQIERVYQHLTEKYGENGYAKVYLEDKEFDESIKKLRQALSNKEEFIKRVKRVVKES